MSLSARSLVGIRSLAYALTDLPQASRPAVAARIMAEGIMTARQWWVRLGIWVLKKRGFDVYSAWAYILSRKPEFADELIDQTAHWIMNGKDSDGEGIGGLNQREVDTLVRIIDLAADSPKPPAQE